MLTDEEVEGDVKASLGMLKRVIKEIPSSTMSHGKRDPWLHFYEDFLQEYDPKLRKDAGAYYTPLQVVHAQVRLVDDILRTRMGKPMGFAEGGVTTMDPAVGTGTYLLAVIEQAMPRVIAEEGIGAGKARASLLAQNLFGFEIMVGPYAVAALRMTRLLQDFGGGIPGDGVQIFLNNTLESPKEVAQDFPLMYRAIGLEHQRAKRVKESVPVLVCIGNPPYDRHGKATVDNKMSTGAWVRWGESLKGKDAILNDFIDPVRKAGKGGRLSNLYNLYVYFWRWGLWKAFEQPFAQTGGVVSFITASSFLDGDAFLGMRQKMRTLCDEIWVIDLGGDGRGTQQDDNVFAIQTPVAITIAVRYKQASPLTQAKVHYTRIEGSRAKKLSELDAINELGDLVFSDCQADWGSPFRPKDLAALYFVWPKLSDLMPWQQAGCKYERTWPIASAKSLLEKRWKSFLKSTDRALAFKENNDRTITSKVSNLVTGNILPSLAELTEIEPIGDLVPYGFRSFDRQFAIADNRLGGRLRPVLWQILSSQQWYFVSLTSNVITSGPAMTVSTHVPDLHYFRGSFGAKDIIPLYRDDKARQPNIHPELLDCLMTKMQIKVTPENWGCYLYCVMAQPGYVSEFQQELGNKDIHVPVSLDPILFQQAVTIGKQLLFLHSFGERFTNEFPRLGGSAKCQKAVSRNIPIHKFNYDDTRHSLFVGDGEFGPVMPEVWSFEVSGLKVLQSWLAYRMATHSGKKTSPLDDIGLEEWTADLTSELLRLLWVLEKTLSIGSDQDALLGAILAGNLLLADDLGEVPAAYKKAPKSKIHQEQLEL